MRFRQTLVTCEFETVVVGRCDLPIGITLAENPKSGEGQSNCHSVTNVVRCEHRVSSLRADLVHGLWSRTVLVIWCTVNEAYKHRNEAVSSSGGLHRNADVKGKD